MAGFKSARERFLMSITAIAVLFGGGYLFAYKPVYARYQDLDQQINSSKTKWEQSVEDFVRSKEYRAEFDRIRESLSLEGTEGEKKLRINEELTRLLDETGIVPKSRTENNPERIGDDFKSYSFSLKNIETDWPTVARFLYEVENNPAVLEVKKIEVRKNPTKTAPASQAIRVDIDITRIIEHEWATGRRKLRGR